MRISALICFLCMGITGHAQFKVHNKSICHSTYVNSTYELAKDSSVTGLNIFPMLFQFNDNVAVKTLGELECIYYEFSFSPDSPDSEKKEFIDALIDRLRRLEFLMDSPKLKAVYFHIGEQIFMTSDEIKNCKGNYKKMAKINLENAWDAFGKDLQARYPGIKFYAENWNW